MNKLYMSRGGYTQAKIDYPTGANHGATWSTAETEALRKNFAAQTPFETLCAAHQRSAMAVKARLVSIGLIKINYNTYNYHYTDAGQALVDDFCNFEENNMNDNCKSATPYADDTASDAPLIETVVLIHGKRADKMNDDQIFSMIANLEAAVEALDKVKNKPKKLQDRIAAVNDDIAKLVAHVDGR